MPGKVMHIGNLQGLPENEVTLRRQRFGKNIIEQPGSRRILHIALDIVREPMFILLTLACLLYFILQENSEGFMMLLAMVFVTTISFYQETKSSRALEALRQYTEPRVTVIRDGREQVINSEELVPGDLVIIEEGNKVPADAEILQANDLSVNESLLTGESLPVEKSERDGASRLFQGTTINSGKCVARVTATGGETALAKLGKSVAGYNPPKTLLQQQVNRFVRRLAFFGIIAFLLIFAVNYVENGFFVQSLLFGLTLAMAAIPEEIPVAFSSFMALGAYHMSKLGIITRQPQTIENLGAMSVLCLDKTGTITENKMELRLLYDFPVDRLYDLEATGLLPDGRVLRYAMLASEIYPFDSMEKAIGEAYRVHIGEKEQDALKMIYEYPLQGHPPMMTHVYQFENRKTVAAKGAVERVLRVCRLDEAAVQRVNARVQMMAEKGFRVLGVASAVFTDGDFPVSQDEFNWQFEGLISFYDPPKKNIADVFRQFAEAGINCKLLTGDYPETAVQIAGQVGMTNYLKYFSGDQVMEMKEEELRNVVQSVNLFARMFPEAKLRVIEALKANGEIVGMTGDGVNDGPALKASDIGIAMGKKGTEIARQASDLVLTDDNLQKVSEAIQQGRKIHSNFKKAIRYIISIHIPIILTAALPVLLGWEYPNIFTPIHVIFLELIMGPTCSIFFEREPVEPDLMKRPPRSRTARLFRDEELLISIIQGLAITAGVLSLYYIYMNNGQPIEKTRMVVFTTLVISNILLTFVNRSFVENLSKTIFYRNRLAPWVLLLSTLFLLMLHLVPGIRGLFGLSPITGAEFLLCAAVALASVLWFELLKTNMHKRPKSTLPALSQNHPAN